MTLDPLSPFKTSWGSPKRSFNTLIQEIPKQSSKFIKVFIIKRVRVVTYMSTQLDVRSKVHLYSKNLLRILNQNDIEINFILFYLLIRNIIARKTKKSGKIRLFNNKTNKIYQSLTHERSYVNKGFKIYKSLLKLFKNIFYELIISQKIHRLYKIREILICIGLLPHI